MHCESYLSFQAFVWEEKVKLMSNIERSQKTFFLLSRQPPGNKRLRCLQCLLYGMRNIVGNLLLKLNTALMTVNVKNRKKWKVVITVDFCSNLSRKLFLPNRFSLQSPFLSGIRDWIDLRISFPVMKLLKYYFYFPWLFSVV